MHVVSTSSESDKSIRAVKQLVWKVTISPKLPANTAVSGPTRADIRFFTENAPQVLSAGISFAVAPHSPFYA